MGLVRYSAITSSVELKLYYQGELLVDEIRAKLLMLIDRHGSILAASKILGIPYSRAWECISRIERVVGEKIVEAKRGLRGGARLTSVGQAILERYIGEYRRVFGREFNVSTKPCRLEGDVLVYSGSHDIVVEKILGMLRSMGYRVESYWIGSLKGLASIALGESCIAGIHLLDTDTGVYNKPYVEKTCCGLDIVYVDGYLREQGFIAREKLGYREIIDQLLSGKLRLINRNKGSGTRLLVDYILARESSKRGVRDYKSVVKGYGEEAYTHIDVARKIASGEADVGVGIRWAAEAYNLYFTPIKWERFDFIILKSCLDKEPVKEFLRILRTSIDEIIHKLRGYKRIE